MSAADEVAIAQTTIQDAAVSQAGFGTPLIAAAHSLWPETVRTFGSLDELATAGCPTTHHIYKEAAGLMAQDISVSGFMVGKRRTAAYTQVLELTVDATDDGDVASLTVDGEAISAAQASGDKAGPLNTAINAAISSGAGVESGGVITLTCAAADTLLAVEDLVGVTIKDVTPDTGIAADLAAIRLADGAFYGLLIDGHSEAQINAAAAWAQTQKMIAMFVSQDSELYDPSVTDDVASDLETSGLQRTPILYHTRPVSQCGAARWTGLMLPKDPGAASWANKHPVGLDKDSLSDGQIAALKGKHCNFYMRVGDLGFTKHGWSGGGRYMDITRGIDWFDARMTERLLALQANSEKIPYTDEGVGMVEAQVLAQLAAGIGVGLIAANPAPVVTVPKVADASPNDKALRILPGISYRFTLQGAADQVTVTGTATL